MRSSGKRRVGTKRRSVIEAGQSCHARADVVAKDLGISRSLVFAKVYRLAAKRRP
jgi:hypothetical protein